MRDQVSKASITSNPFDLAENSLDSSQMVVDRLGIRLDFKNLEQFKFMPVSASSTPKNDDLELCNYKTEQNDKPYNPLGNLKQMVSSNTGALSIGILTE